MTSQAFYPLIRARPIPRLIVTCLRPSCHSGLLTYVRIMHHYSTISSLSSNFTTCNICMSSEMIRTMMEHIHYTERRSDLHTKRHILGQHTRENIHTRGNTLIRVKHMERYTHKPIYTQSDKQTKRQKYETIYTRSDLHTK